MKLSDVDRFDSTLFSKDELAGLQQFVNICVKAKTADAIEEAGADLDLRRKTNHVEMKIMAQRSRSLNAVYKELIMEVPRPRGKAVIK